MVSMTRRMVAHHGVAHGVSQTIEGLMTTACVSTIEVRRGACHGNPVILGSHGLSRLPIVAHCPLLGHLRGTSLLRYPALVTTLNWQAILGLPLPVLYNEIVILRNLVLQAIMLGEKI